MNDLDKRWGGRYRVVKRQNITTGHESFIVEMWMPLTKDSHWSFIARCSTQQEAEDACDLCDRKDKIIETVVAE